MATKKQLLERWQTEDGKAILANIDQYFDAIHPLNRQGPTPVGTPQELEEIVRELPFVEDVPKGRDLRGLPIWQTVLKFDFTGWDFSFARLQLDMCDCILDRTRFDSALSYGILMGSTMRGASFVGANLSGASAEKVTARECNFENATLRSTRFDNSDLTGSSFVNAKAQNANFAGATLLGCNFQRAKLDGAVIVDAKIDKSTDLRGSSLVNLMYQEHRNQFGELMWPENDWRQASYDENTIYGEHPALHEQELLKALLTLMKELDTPDAKSIATQLRKARAVIPKDPDHWIETVFAVITPEQTKILESAMFDAVKMVE